MTPAQPGSGAPGPVPPGAASSGAPPAWLTELAARAGEMRVPPRLRAPAQGGRFSAVLLLFGERLRQDFGFGPVGVHHIAAFRIINLSLIAQLLPDSFEHGKAFDAVRPVTISRETVIVGV